jgi:adenylosuccinate lyase
VSELSVYDNPLIVRYASQAAAERWGPQRKFQTWRRLWFALAEAQHELGLTAADGRTPRIRPEHLAQLAAHLNDPVDLDRAAEHERRLRHDVMAHIHTFAEVVPETADILHLGATSCYVTDNADLVLMREALDAVIRQLAGVLDALGQFAERWKQLPTLGYTHFQPAQLTTVGKRACLWAYDLVLDLQDLEHRRSTLCFRGAKGTTGTQASFLALFHGDHDKVRQLDRLVAQKMGFEKVYAVTGQTYPRKVDSQVLDALGGLGQSLQKWGNDLRLLAHEREIDEPFAKDQVGSSAMAYKRNPMLAERMCSLGRWLSGLPAMAAQTAATQWLERTLDDSAIRRLTLPQSFLAADACLRIADKLARGLEVNEAVIARHVAEHLPFMMTENLIMAGVAAGGDRQVLHERIRVHSQAVTAALKAGASQNDLLDRLRADAAFAGVDVGAVTQPAGYVGRAPEQVDEFVREQIQPVRDRHGVERGSADDLAV